MSLKIEKVTSCLIPYIAQGLFIFFLPLILCLTALSFVFKQFVIRLAPHFGKKFSRPVESDDLTFLSEEVNGRSSTTITVVFILKGLPDRLKVVRALDEAYNQKTPDRKDLVHWKLSVYPEQWLGFWFWAEDTSFSMENQVETFEDIKVMSEKDIPLLVQRLITKPFPKRKPMWDINIVPNYQGSPHKSILVFRMSHAVFDGLSFVKFYYRLAGFQKLPPDFPRFAAKQRSLRESFLFWAECLGTGVFQYLNLIKNLPDVNPILNLKTDKPTGEWLCSYVPVLSVSQVKKARLAFNCTFYDILMVGVSGGVNRFMLKKGGPLPAEISGILPLPRPDHPDYTISNHL
jgi:hypothetical protein